MISYTLFGDSLYDAFDPRMRKKGRFANRPRLLQRSRRDSQAEQKLRRRQGWFWDQSARSIFARMG